MFPMFLTQKRCEFKRFSNTHFVVFKPRESDDPKSFCPTRANGLVELVTNAIHEKCRIVNQVGSA